MSEVSITYPSITNISFNPEIVDSCRGGSMIFKGISLKQDSVSFIHENVIDLHISHELNTWSRHLNTEFTLGNCLFMAVKLIKNSDPDKYKYIGYGIGFEKFLWSDSS